METFKRIASSFKANENVGLYRAKFSCSLICRYNKEKTDLNSVNLDIWNNGFVPLPFSLTFGISFYFTFLVELAL